MRKRKDELLHELAAAARDLSVAVALYEGEPAFKGRAALGGQRFVDMLRANDRLEAVLQKVVEREGDILPPREAKS